MRAARAGVVVLLIGLAVVAAAGESTRGWKTFKGQWFDVKYPPDFRAVGRDQTPFDKYDGASFLSPDGKVEFYVYSPRFQGDSWWLKRRTGETLGDRSTETGSKYTIKYGAFRGPKGKYTRAYAAYTNKNDGSQHVFGIRYNSKTAYNKWKSKYVAFKTTLVQYAD